MGALEVSSVSESWCVFTCVCEVGRSAGAGCTSAVILSSSVTAPRDARVKESRKKTEKTARCCERRYSLHVCCTGAVLTERLDVAHDNGIHENKSMNIPGVRQISETGQLAYSLHFGDKTASKSPMGPLKVRKSDKHACRINAEMLLEVVRNTCRHSMFQLEGHLRTSEQRNYPLLIAAERPMAEN